MDLSRQLANVDDARAFAQAIVDTIREPLLVLDDKLRIIAASRSFYLTFCVNRQDTQGQFLYSIGDGQWDIPALRDLLERIIPENENLDDYHVEHIFPSIGRRIMLLNARRLFYEDGANSTILLAIEDITRRKDHEQEMQNLLEQKEFLLEEMQHRIANSLQIIASIIMLKARTVQSPETRYHLEDAHKRVMSVAAIQQNLQVARQGEAINVSSYLSKLCLTLAQSMIGENRDLSLEVKADNSTLSSRDAVSIGLIVTEAVINSLKHAYSADCKNGRIIVSYETRGESWTLDITDNGTGKASVEPAAVKAGLGTSIVSALAHQLDARVDMESGPGGTSVKIIHLNSCQPIPQAA